MDYSKRIRDLFRKWEKDHDETVRAALEDTVEEGGEEAADLLKRLEHDSERNRRRDQMEWVVREQGSLEEGLWLVRELDPVVPYGSSSDTERVRTPDGRVLYPAGEPFRIGLWMTHPPEWLERDLERDHGWGGEYNTVYTDGGGFQNEMPAFLQDVKTKEVWERVYSGAHGAEVECPLADWDPERGEERQGGAVTLTDTYYGEHPGEFCMYCGEKIDDDHNALYVGEGGEYVYMLLKKEDE